MTMRLHAFLLASLGEYTDAGGRKVKKSVRVGCLFKDDQSGRMSARLDLIPAAPSWSGWLRVAPADDDENGGNDA